jgi:hypothetical protein
MPRKTRTRRLPRDEYHVGHFRQLVTGFDFRLPSPAFGMDGNLDVVRRDDAETAWSLLREEILADHIAAHPCTRPWAWWHLETRDLRQRVDGGGHPCLPPLSRPAWYGLPRYISQPDEFKALYESVPAYLARLGLLTRSERAYLDANPELLEPVYADDGRGWE